MCGHRVINAARASPHTPHRPLLNSTLSLPPLLFLSHVNPTTPHRPGLLTPLQRRRRPAVQLPVQQRPRAGEADAERVRGGVTFTVSPGIPTTTSAAPGTIAALALRSADVSPAAPVAASATTRALTTVPPPPSAPPPPGHHYIRCLQHRCMPSSLHRMPLGLLWGCRRLA